jgi:hypothetical protein
VITTVPTADRQKATVLVRIAFEALDPRILPDMGVKVTFLREAAASAEAAPKPTALVPKSAVRNTGGTNHVFVVRGDVVERRAIQTAGTDGDRLEVSAGLSAGDRVVIAPPDTLGDGGRITVKQGS